VRSTRTVVAARLRAMDIRMVTLDGAAEAEGVVVVVDVLRAFTVAALALDRGATAVRCVRTVEEALEERAANPGSLAMGEVDGRPIPGFDLSNSPSTLLRADVRGRLLVHRTTAGTQGVVGSARAAHLYATSFACATATARAVAALAPVAVTFVLTGVDDRDGDEDRACAEYVAAFLRGGRPDPTPYLARVGASDAGRRFVADDDPDFPAADVAVATRLDAVDIALRAEQHDGRSTLTAQRT
jgi:2-phosphosulfolactate phosphatase